MRRVPSLLLVTLVLLALPAAADVLNVYTVGSSPAGNALDQFGNNIGGIPVISFSLNSGCAAGPGCVAFLGILAEGVDGGPNAPGGGEHDAVYLNGNLLGYLTQQGFYSPLFNLKPGPGALPDITAETWSFFDVSALVLLGANQIDVVVDPGNWVNEIEVGALASTPEPGSMVLLGTGLLGIAGAVRRKLGA